MAPAQAEAIAAQLSGHGATAAGSAPRSGSRSAAATRGGAAGGLRAALMPLARRRSARLARCGGRSSRHRGDRQRQAAADAGAAHRARWRRASRGSAPTGSSSTRCTTPPPRRSARAEIRRALEDDLASGQGAGGGGGGRCRGRAAAALDAGAPYGAIQLAAPEPGAATRSPPAPRRRASGGSPIRSSGSAETWDALRQRLAADPAAAARLAAAEGGDAEAGLAAALLGAGARGQRRGRGAGLDALGAEPGEESGRGGAAASLRRGRRSTRSWGSREAAPAGLGNQLGSDQLGSDQFDRGPRAGDGPPGPCGRGAVAPPETARQSCGSHSQDPACERAGRPSG